MNTSTEEFVDLVNEYDEIVGKILLTETYAKPIKNIRVIYAFLVNARGKIWIPKRVPTKEIFPNSLDLSLFTYVRSGEDYDTAFRRAAMSKLHIDIDQISWKFLAHCTPTKDGVSAFAHVYLIQSDILPEFDVNEFSESRWITPEEIIKKVEIRESVRDDLGVLTKLYIENNWGE